jgi:hypothetical protein
MKSLFVSFVLLLTTLYVNTKKGDYQNPRYVENQREKGRKGKPTSQCAAGVQGTPAGELSVR